MEDMFGVIKEMIETLAPNLDQNININFFKFDDDTMLVDFSCTQTYVMTKKQLTKIMVDINLKKGEGDKWCVVYDEKESTTALEYLCCELARKFYNDLLKVCF